jgi:hypothetical protein
MSVSRTQENGKDAKKMGHRPIQIQDPVFYGQRYYWDVFTPDLDFEIPKPSLAREFTLD